MWLGPLRIERTQWSSGYSWVVSMSLPRRFRRLLWLSHTTDRDAPES